LSVENRATKVVGRKQGNFGCLDFLDLWTSGPLDLWTSGPLDLWTSGPLDLRGASPDSAKQVARFAAYQIHGGLRWHNTARCVTIWIQANS